MSIDFSNTKPTLTRGKWEVVHTVLLFINDDEESLITFSSKYGIANVRISFKPEQSGSPIVHTYPVPSEHSIHFRFIGWNTQLAYSAIEPTKFASKGDSEIAFSACNTYLNGTNKIEIQFYTRNNHE